MKKWWKIEPVLLVQVDRRTKENISKFTIRLDWKGVLKLLIHRKIMVVVQHYPMILKCKMSSVNNDEFTFDVESGGQDG